MEALFVEHLNFFYSESESPAVSDVSFSLKRGEFLVLCGPSGCGKSTLLRQFKPAWTPQGKRSGTLLFEGRSLENLDLREQSERIGFVQQLPERQMVTDRVWHELAFGLESLGYDTAVIRRRVAETAAFFGMQEWISKRVSELSGGQKQLLNLAAVMTLRPSLLLLDEPTGQLDPMMADRFLSMLDKIHKELGIAILLAEHRLEPVLQIADRIAVMEQGRLLFDGAPREIGLKLRSQDSVLFSAMPTPMRVWASVDSTAQCPMTIGEGRRWLEQYTLKHPLRPVPKRAAFSQKDEAVLCAEDLWFRYKENAPEVVRGLHFSLQKGEIAAILGGNGAGKSTALKLLAGVLTPERGELCCKGKTALLPQDPATLFLKKTVREELLDGIRDTADDSLARVDAAKRLLGLERLWMRHPYDLSGGEQQRVAFAKVLLTGADILLLDEPTKGMDSGAKRVFAELLRTLCRQGKSILLVSHDVEFCAENVQRCGLFFDGTIINEAPVQEFFSENNFYTTAASRMSKTLLQNAVTAADLICACGGRAAEEPMVSMSETEGGAAETKQTENASENTVRPLPLWRKGIAAISGVIGFVFLVQILRTADVSELLRADGMARLSGNLWMQTIPVFLSIFCFTAALYRSPKKEKHAEIRLAESAADPPQKKMIGLLPAVLLLIALTVFLGETVLSERKYYFVSLLVLLECMIPFFFMYEKKKPSAGTAAVLAALCAIGTAGRAAFFMLPQFKPVMALTILCGAALGSESGFLVGAGTMFVSNMMFGQGPWTPWQMAAMGLIGGLAGLVFRRKEYPGHLCLFGIVAAFLYGSIMNPAAALIWVGEWNRNIIFAYYASGFPMDCVQAAANVFFLRIAAEPMLEKLERIRRKYWG